MSLHLEPETPAPVETRIVVPVERSPEAGHIVLVETAFVNELAKVEERVKALAVTDAATSQTCSDLQRRMTTAGTRLAAMKREAKAPYLAMCDAIENALRDPAARIEDAKKLLKEKQAAFLDAEAARVKKAEEDRQKEIARLKKLADDEAARIKAAADKLAEEARLNQEAEDRERARIAAENEAKRKAGLPAPMNLSLEDDEPEAPQEPPPPPAKSAAEIALEQALHAPAPVAAAPSGLAMRVTLEIKTVDVALLPDPFVTKTANLQAIRRTFCVGYAEGQPLPVCDGVVFEVKREPVSTRARI